MSAGAPASICFANALLAPYETITLLPVLASNCLGLFVQRLFEARGREDRHVGRRWPRATRQPALSPARSTIVHPLSQRMRIPVREWWKRNIQPYIPSTQASSEVPGKSSDGMLDLLYLPLYLCKYFAH